jgi:PAS domain S-box-containing protein
MAVGRPIELIQARGLISKIWTPAFLTDKDGTLVYYNDAAAELLGLSFEEAEGMPIDEWGTRFGPFDSEGNQIPVDELPLTIALRAGRPSHEQFRIRSADGREHEIEVSAIPLTGAGERSGGIAIFWPAEDE